MTLSLAAEEVARLRGRGIEGWRKFSESG